MQESQRLQFSQHIVGAQIRNTPKRTRNRAIRKTFGLYRPYGVLRRIGCRNCNDFNLHNFLLFENILLFFDKKLLTNRNLYVIMRLQGIFSGKFTPFERNFTMTRRKVSLYASMLVTAILFVFIIAACLFLPKILEMYSDFRGGINCTDLMIALYFSALPGLICCVSLLKLLFNIHKDEIFVHKNVTLLQILSYCCFFVGLEYIVLGHKYISMLFFAFAALFIGLILRVVKNVFDKAIELREENDYTI